ncbi:MAG: carboxypeptidase-like regulatory domain-containing protein [Bacteroidota bacterium]
MRTIFVVLFFYSLSGFAQISIQGTVRDSKRKAPLSFCGITLKSTKTSCIANEDGGFRINVNSEKDSIVISFLGYKSKTLVASSILNRPLIFLEPKDILIDEVVIHADDDYLFDIMQECRERINRSLSHQAKAYFNLETEYQKQIVEMLACYYNATFNGNSIEELNLKNGRIGLAVTSDSSYFVSMNTSRAITYLNLTHNNEYLPKIPFQFSKNKMRHHFLLKMIAVYESGSPVYHIAFSPRINDGNSFHGEVWIDKSTYTLLKVTLSGENLKTHPFLPMWPKTSIDSVSISIMQTYELNDKAGILHDLNFSYSLIFKKKEFQRDVKTKGVMYFYDLEKPFILPYFDYDVTQSDYRKITFFPYNASFWNHSNGLLNTRKQSENLSFLKKNGLLLNYNHKLDADLPINKLNLVHGKFFEDNYVYWSDTSRLSLKKNSICKDSLVNLNVQKVKADLYQFKAQVFLDVNEIGDSLHCFSATVFDVFDSFYKLTEEKTSNCFLNIFFDIYEIERRNMDKKLRESSHNKEQIDLIYKLTIETIEAQTALYLKKTQSGDNFAELKIWNDYVFKNLGIDNFMIFKINDTISN